MFYFVSFVVCFKSFDLNPYVTKAKIGWSRMLSLDLTLSRSCDMVSQSQMYINKQS